MRAASSTRGLISAFGKSLQPQAERHVLDHRHVRIERVVLEHHGDVAVLRRHVVDDVAADGDLAAGDVLQARDHAQRRRLAAARRARPAPRTRGRRCRGRCRAPPRPRRSVLTILRSETSRHRLPSALGRAGGQAGDVVVHQEGVDDQRRRGAQQRAGHDLPPVEHVALDQRRDDADRQHQLVGRGGERERIEELRPGHGEGEDRRGDDAGQRHRDEDLGQRLDPAGAVDQRRLVELLRDRGEVADHDPGAERHRQRRIEDQQHPPAIDQLDAGPLVEDREHLEQRDEQQRLRDQVGQEHAGRERRRAPEPHARQREGGRNAISIVIVTTTTETIAELRKKIR